MIHQDDRHECFKGIKIGRQITSFVNTTYNNILILWEVTMVITYPSNVHTTLVYNKGTKAQHVPLIPQNSFWHKSHNDMVVTAGRGTRKINMRDMEILKPVEIKGRYITARKGTTRIQL